MLAHKTVSHQIPLTFHALRKQLDKVTNNAYALHRLEMWTSRYRFSIRGDNFEAALGEQRNVMYGPLPEHLDGLWYRSTRPLGGQQADQTEFHMLLVRL